METSNTTIDKAMLKLKRISSKNGGNGSVIIDRHAKTKTGVPILIIETFL